MNLYLHRICNRGYGFIPRNQTIMRKTIPGVMCSDIWSGLFIRYKARINDPATANKATNRRFLGGIPKMPSPGMNIILRILLNSIAEKLIMAAKKRMRETWRTF